MEFINDDSFFSKLELVLGKLITPALRIPDDTVFQKLFDSLSNVFLVEECQEKLINLFVPWLSSLTSQWKVIHMNSRVFALQIIGLVCQNDSFFSILKENNSLSEVFNNFRNDGEGQFSLTLAFIDVLSSCMKHSAGISWIFETGCWKDVLKISLSNKSLYALRKSQNFIAEIMVSQFNDNTSISQSILDRSFNICCNVVNSIHNNRSTVLKNIRNKKESIPDNLTSLNPVMLLREIFLHLLDKNMSSEKLLMLSFSKITDWAWKTIEETENPLVLLNVSKLLCVLNIINTPHETDEKVNYSDVRIASQKVINHCSILIRKKEFELVQEVCVEYLMLWNRFGKEIIDNPEDLTTYSFESTPFTILSNPLHMFLQFEIVMESDILNKFADELSDISCAQTKQACYLYKDHFSLHSGTNIKTLAISAIRCYVRMENIIRKVYGLVVFNTLFHVMKKIIPRKYAGFEFAVPDGYFCGEEQLPENLTLLSTALETLVHYIPPVDATWRSNLEKSCIIHLVQGILEIPNIPPRMYVEALKVTTFILNGHLRAIPPLPLDMPIELSMDNVCRQMYKLLHSVQWEIRDSAIEVLQVFCLLTEHNMKELQSLLVDSNFPDLLLSAAQNDSEPYVRASALACLKNMVRLNVIWESALQHQALIDKVGDVLMNDPEGIVRHKAVMLLEAIYKYRSLSQEDLDKMFDLLCNVTLRDLHWEVKKASIVFWDSVFKKILMDAGVNNGEFGTHTVQNGQLIKVTPKDKSLRLSKVFNKLSAYGCLHVLWEVIQHDSDLEVTKEAGKLILKMIPLAQRFDVLALVKDIKMLTNDTDTCINGKTENANEKIEEQLSAKDQTGHQKMSTDEVIESIVSEGDINLLAGLLKTDNSPSSTLLLKSRKKLEVEKFFANVLKFNVNKSENEKVEWISKTSDGIISLFDDILLSNQSQFDKANVIDCY